MFSVVIPLYNKELSIQKTLQSVLDQTYQEFEIIVIDDGSTDASAEKVKELKDSRIKLIQQKNAGVSAARNRGIKEARYEWIALLDGDDLWDSDHLEEVLKMMSIFPYENIYATSFRYSDGRKVLSQDILNPIYRVDNYFKLALQGHLIWTGIIVFHKKAFDEAGRFNIKLNRGEDLDLWIRLANKYDIIKSSKQTATYNVEELNSLTKNKSEYNKSIISVLSLKNKQGFEKKYLKKLILKRLKLNIKNCEVVDLIKALIRYNIHLISK